MFGDILERKPVSIAFSKSILSKVKKPNYEQKVTLEYASKFAKVGEEDAEKLFDELKEANIPRVKDKHIIKIIDIMPASPDELKAILAKEDLTLGKEDMEKIIEVLSRYR